MAAGRLLLIETDGWVVGPADLDSDELTGVDWADLTDPIDERLAEDYDWPALTATLNRATAAGYDVSANLARLAAADPLPDQHPARELAYRVIADYLGALPVTDPPAGVTAAADPSRPPSCTSTTSRPRGRRTQSARNCAHPSSSRTWLC